MESMNITERALAAAAMKAQMGEGDVETKDVEQQELKSSSLEGSLENAEQKAEQTKAKNQQLKNDALRKKQQEKLTTVQRSEQTVDVSQQIAQTRPTVHAKLNELTKKHPELRDTKTTDNSKKRRAVSLLNDQWVRNKDRPAAFLLEIFEKVFEDLYKDAALADDIFGIIEAAHGEEEDQSFILKLKEVRTLYREKHKDELELASISLGPSREGEAVEPARKRVSFFESTTRSINEQEMTVHELFKEVLSKYPNESEQSEFISFFLASARDYLEKAGSDFSKPEMKMRVDRIRDIQRLIGGEKLCAVHLGRMTKEFNALDLSLSKSYGSMVMLDEILKITNARFVASSKFRESAENNMKSFLQSVDHNKGAQFER